MFIPANGQNMLVINNKAASSLVSVSWSGMSEQPKLKEIGTKRKSPQFVFSEESISCTGSDHEL